MTKEICRYHNDLNKVQLPNFNEVQLNIFYSLLFKMRDKKLGEVVIFKAQEIRTMIGDYRESNVALYNLAYDLFYKLFKADFKILLTDEECKRGSERIINIFKDCVFNYEKLGNAKQLINIEMEMNERFEYLLNELIGNYTEFELAELVNLSGKYTKLLYTHLKQFRTTGEWIVEWDEFKRVMDIPKALKPSDIDKILNHSIKELSAEVTLFDQKRIPFKNLTFQKLTHSKEPNRKRLKPHWIRFTFTKEHSTQSLNIDLNGKYFLQKDSTNREFVYRVIEVKKEPKKIIIVCSVFDKRMNSISPYFTFDFKDFVEAERFVMKNLYTIS